MIIGVDDQISSFPLARDAGIGYVNRAIFQHLPTLLEDDDQVIWYSNAKRSLDKEHERFSHSPSFLPTRVSLVRVFWQQVVLPFLLYWDRVDVLLATAFVSPIFSRVPTVLLVHDLYFLKDPDGYRGSLRVRYLRWLTKRSIRRAQKVVCSSAATRQDVLSLVPGVKNERVCVAHLGFNEAFGEPIERKSPAGVGPAVDRPYLLFVGTLEPKKNLSFLLDCFKASSWLRNNYYLVVVGKSGWGQEAIEQEIGQLPWVVKAGYVSQDDLLAHYAGAKLFLFPSLGEGFGYPALEAMACKTPVVASDQGSLPEVCQDAALVLPLEVDKWSDGILRLLKDKEECVRLVTKGSSRIKDFAWSKYLRVLFDKDIG